MGRPLLPQFAKAFAGQLKARIEAEAPAAGPEPQPAAAPAKGLGAWLAGLWRALFGRKRQEARP
jgi:hypothetical protein